MPTVTAGALGSWAAAGTDAYVAAYATMANPESLNELVRQLGPMTVVFVPGFLARSVQRWGVPFCCVGPDRYFSRQRRWLSDEGVANSYLDLDSEATIEVNARGVADAIAAAGSQVVLVTHSKGGLDSLAALVDRADLRPRIAAWVALQAPFHGAGLADLAGKLRIDRLLRWFGWAGDAIGDMQTERRRAYHTDHAAEIRAVLGAVPTICYGSYMVGASCLWVLGRLSRAGVTGRNDGLVGPDSALLDGALGVLEADVDHLMPVLGTDRAKLDPVRCLAALLSVRLQAR